MTRLFCFVWMGLLSVSSATAQMITEKPESTGGNPEGIWEAVHTPLKVYAPPELLAIVSNLNFDGTTSGRLTLEENGAYQIDLSFDAEVSAVLLSPLGALPVAFDIADTNRASGTYAVSGTNLILQKNVAGALPDTAAFTVVGDSLYLVQAVPLGDYQALVSALAPAAGPPLAVLGLKRVGPPPVAGPVTADFNGDGAVDFSDFLAFVSRFGARTGELRYDPMFDLDGNGEIGFTDFLSFAAQFGRRV